MSMELRPLSLGELLDRAFALYKSHLWLFVGLMAVPSIVSLAMGLFVQILNRIALGGSPADAPDVAQTIIMATAMIGGVFILIVAYFIVYVVALGATTVAVSELYLGRAATIRSAYQPVRTQVGRLMLLLIFVGLRYVGLVLVLGLLIPVMLAALRSTPFVAFFAVMGLVVVVLALFVLFTLRYALCVPALVLEHITAGAAIRRSVALTRGNLGRTFLLVLCAVVITYAALLIFQGPFMLGVFVAGPESTMGFWFNIMSLISGTIGGTFCGPIMIIGLALLYYDIRIRNEGLDLQLMMATLDQTGTTAPGAPSPALIRS